MTDNPRTPLKSDLDEIKPTGTGQDRGLLLRTEIDAQIAAAHICRMSATWMREHARQSSHFDAIGPIVQPSAWIASNREVKARADLVRIIARARTEIDELLREHPDLQAELARSIDILERMGAAAEAG